MTDNDISMRVVKSGWLKKKGGQISQWGDRYFILRGNCLSYYVKSTDAEPKGIYNLTPNCLVSEIRSDFYKRRKQYVFKIIWPNTIDDDHIKKNNTSSSPPQTTKRRPIYAGLGFIASVVGIGSNNGIDGNSKERNVILACDSYTEADSWARIIQGHLATLGTMPTGSGASRLDKPLSEVIYAPPTDMRLSEVEHWVKNAKWKAFCFVDGVRIFEHCIEVTSPSDLSTFTLQTGALGQGLVPLHAQDSVPCLRVNLPVGGSPSEVFMTVMNFPLACCTGIVRSLRVVESLDNCTDIIHMQLDEIFVYPSWTAPRDFCLMRYWKHNSDGSFIVCLDSTVHIDCPLVPGSVRGDLHAAYICAPPKTGGTTGADDEDYQETMLTFIARLNPCGWVWGLFGSRHQILREFMLHVLDVRDVLDASRFVRVQFDPVYEDRLRKGNAVINKQMAEETRGTIATIPATADADSWAEVDASTFKVRSLTYAIDKVKTQSAPSLFKLIGVDNFEVSEPTMTNICAHPRNRVALAAQRGETTWVFAMNIMVPGPPYLSFVMYWEGDRNLIGQDTPFGRVAKRFFYGNDDEFRNSRFKLIPKIVDGNMMIKMAVKDTPTLLGNKLKTTYHKGDNYFEIDVDVGSSSIARNVVGLALGYSKAIVVDMGICLQGEDENELPEVLMCGCSWIHFDTAKARKL